MTRAEAERLDRLGADLLEMVDGRSLVVHLSRAHERRLLASIERFNLESPEDPLNPCSDDDLAIVLLATSERGLRDGEDDAGVWTDCAGREYPLPRTRRAAVTMRIRFALRAAATLWRST